MEENCAASNISHSSRSACIDSDMHLEGKMSGFNSLKCELHLRFLDSRKKKKELRQLRKYCEVK